MTELLLQALYSGVLIGGFYAMIALGLALVFGTMRLINLAHGEFVVLSAYVAYHLERVAGLNPVLAIPAAVLVTGAVALATYWAIGQVRQDREINSLILTFGLAIVITNLIRITWSNDARSTTNAWFQDSVDLGGLVFSAKAELLFFAVGLALLLGVWLWLAKTSAGRAVRAVASNRQAAMLMGVNPARVEALSFMVAALLASVAGVAVYTIRTIDPTLGHAITVKAFVITVLAGLGSVPGVLVGAVMLGVSEQLMATFGKASLQELAAMAIFLAVLFLKPAGLFGGKGAVRR